MWEKYDLEKEPFLAVKGFVKTELHKSRICNGNDIKGDNQYHHSTQLMKESPEVSPSDFDDCLPVDICLFSRDACKASQLFAQLYFRIGIWNFRKDDFSENSRSLQESFENRHLNRKPNPFRTFIGRLFAIYRQNLIEIGRGHVGRFSHESITSNLV